MSLRRPALATALVLAGAVPLTAGAASPSCAPPKPAPLRFGAPVYVDTERAGGEPVTQVARDGSIVMSAHAGTTHLYKDPAALPGVTDFVVGYTNQVLNWRSTDGGRTWRFVGLLGQENGPHSLTSSGFSDPDLTMDAGGRIYNAEINLANTSVFTSTDNGASWSPIANPLSATGDRPWLTGMGEDEVFLYMNSTPKQLWHSTDAGLTFTLLDTDFPVDGKMLVDPLHPDGGLLGPVTSDTPAEGTEGRSTGGLSISDDRGATWETFMMEETPKSTAFFSAGAMAVDSAGTVYVATAGGYRGPGDDELDGEVTLSSFNRRTKTWSAPTRIPAPPGDAMWPWVVAGDPGRVAVVWLHRTSLEDEFEVYAAQSVAATGTSTKCRGKVVRHAPRFSVASVTGRPVHVGSICLNGTSCNADPNVAATDRRLGEFVTVSADAQGRLLVAASDTRLPGPTGASKPVANPLFVGQVGGPRLRR